MRSIRGRVVKINTLVGTGRFFCRVRIKSPGEILGFFRKSVSPGNFSVKDLRFPMIQLADAIFRHQHEGFIGSEFHLPLSRFRQERGTVIDKKWERMEFLTVCLKGHTEKKATFSAKLAVDGRAADFVFSVDFS